MLAPFYPENNIYGTDEGVSIAVVNPFRYRSYYYDIATGLYYLQSRYYDPAVGRFVNGDTLETIISPTDLLIYNLFSYCTNSPTLFIDIHGNLGAQLVAKIILGIIIGYYVQIVSDLIYCLFLQLIKGSAASFSPSAGDYLSSMMSWALTCVSFNSKALEIASILVPVLVKQVWRICSGTFDWYDLLIDVAFVVISFVINKGLSSKRKRDLNKIKNKLGNGNGVYNKIKLKNKKLNIKINVLGVKFNFGMNISNFVISTICNFIKSIC